MFPCSLYARIRLNESSLYIGAAGRANIAGQSFLPKIHLLVVIMNKVHVFIDGTPTNALVDTGATLSVMGMAFTDRLVRKFRFFWNGGVPFCGGSGGALFPLVFV